MWANKLVVANHLPSSPAVGYDVAPIERASARIHIQRLAAQLPGTTCEQVCAKMEHASFKGKESQLLRLVFIVITRLFHCRPEKFDEFVQYFTRRLNQFTSC